MRLSKYLAASGIASRRASEELIFQGKVKVNGAIALLPQTEVSEKDKISVDGVAVLGKEEKKYYMLNKPKGYICTAANAPGKRVLDLFAEEGLRLFTVGRLDKDTEGLLIVTNDGHFANRVIHPSSNIRKEYLVKTASEITLEHLTDISKGTIVEGTFVKPIRVTKVRKGTLKVVIGEGKKREVRCLMDAAGLKVIELVRIRIGGLTLGALPVGQFRNLSENEKEAIFS